MSKKKLLWISQYVPYDKVGHASGKIENYYIKSIKKTGFFDILIYTFANINEKEKIDLDNYNIDSDITYYTWEGFKGFFLKFINKISKVWIFRKHAGLNCVYFPQNMIKRIKKLKETGYAPDIIVLDWTEIALIIDEVKKLFPKAKIVCIEEDVCFLGQQRHLMMNYNKILKRCFYSLKYKFVKKAELNMLKKADLVILNNKKDEKLLFDNNFNGNTWVWCPYFNNMIHLKRGNISRDVLFYGAMFREENWKSCLWFIDNVMPLLKDYNVNFIIVGNKPVNQLKERESDNVKVIGFVENVEPFFESSLCLAAPLVLGAGVKIKILEALSSGIPVLTNTIGIEGIDAVKDRDFFFCEKPEEYAKVIKKLINFEIDYKQIEKNSKRFINNNYNLKNDTDTFCKKLLELLMKGDN